MTTTKPLSTGNPRVSLTGYVTASAWAYYGFEHADWFDSRRGRALFRSLLALCRAVKPIAPGPGVFPESLYWRHRWFSAWAVAQAPGLAIEIGAGLSGRGIAYAERNPACQWVDYDLHGMVAARHARMADHDLADNYHLEAGDLLGADLGRDLKVPAAGPVIAMTEGVMDYLDVDEKRRAFQAIARMLERLGGGRYLLEVYPRERLLAFGGIAGLMVTALSSITGRDMNDQLFADADEARALLDECGFESTRVLEDQDLDDAGEAPPRKYRPFVMIEART